MITRRSIQLGLGAIALLVIGLATGAFFIYRDRLSVHLPDYPPIKRALWLDQGWTAAQRHWFHHADQGTQTVNIPYEWFIALEQPRIALVGDVGRLSDPAYLDRYGFIPGATQGGENQLPIGFARGVSMRTGDGEPWLNPRTGEAMTGLGFTCAACHTGRLTYRQTTLLIDGGPALTDLEKFRQGLGISVLFTRLVPGRFDRFAKNVLGEDAAEADKEVLRKQLNSVWDRFDIVRKLDKRVADRSVKEGYGRLDALNRIGNQVFGLDLGKEGRENNYEPTSAPVNFPHIWDTSWFDWVQYNASIEQPMVRNAGEALGVSAPVNLTDPSGLFTSGVQVRKLAEMEKQLAGDQPNEKDGFTGLNAPRWPNDVLGPINGGLAAKGAELYRSLCTGCHLPPIGSKEFWQSKNWKAPSAFGQRHLHVNVISIADINTDPAQAEDMANRKVWIPPHLNISTKEFGSALGELVEKTVTHWYDSQTPPVPASERDSLNGYRPNGIQAPLAYKARPLNGVWATPPYLHNGAVPNVYALLSPVSDRPKSFYLGRREFDPVCMGYQLTATASSEDKLDLGCLGDKQNSATGEFAGGFELDTKIRGNHNTGHEFNDGPRGNGIIGPKLQPEDRRALIEFLKTDCAVGRNSELSADGGVGTSCDALRYSAAPRE
jgi:hypothetical protein